MRRWVWLLVLAACGGGSGSVTLADYPQAFKDAYCRYLARCGEFPDVATCETANIGFNFHIDPSSQAAVDMNKVIFDGDQAAACLDAFGAQTCDSTDESGRSLPASCQNAVRGTVGSGGACAMNAECKSQTCDVPGCGSACCQGTCTGDAPPAPGGAGTSCTSSSNCTSGNYCDFTAMQCAALKPAGATCQSTSECAYGLGCAGTTTRTCKTLPALGEACPDLVCRDAGQYCSSAGTCMKVGLAGAACASVAECSAYYPCDTTAMKCTKGPTSGQACTTGQRCFDQDTFCDTTATAPTCIMLQPDGGACTSSSQCENDNCDMTGSSGVCTTPAVCI